MILDLFVLLAVLSFLLALALNDRMPELAYFVICLAGPAAVALWVELLL